MARKLRFQYPGAIPRIQSWRSPGAAFSFGQARTAATQSACARSKYNHTSLFMGTLNQPPADEDYRKIVKLLLAKGAKADVKNKSGCTPLTMAARVGDGEVVSLLLASGSNVAAKDVNGEAALMIAERLGNEEIKEILTKNNQHGKKGSAK